MTSVGRLFEAAQRTAHAGCDDSSESHAFGWLSWGPGGAPCKETRLKLKPVCSVWLSVGLCTVLAAATFGQDRQGVFSGARRVQPSADDLQLLERYGKRNARVHDPSTIVRCKDRYWLFATGWGIESWYSSDMKHWERGPRMFEQMPSWVTRIVPNHRGRFWAPDIIYLEGRYLLYYSVSEFGSNRSAIALASNQTLDPDDADYGWQDHGVVVRSRREDDFNAIDPALLCTSNGELWMSFGSFWSGIKLIKLDAVTGGRDQQSPTNHAIAWQKKTEIEAPHICEHDGYYYLFVNWGRCCRGVRSTYNVRVGRSRKVTGPYLDREGVDLMKGGGTLLLGSDGAFIGPGHASVACEQERYWLSCHYYDATERGRSRLAILPLTWSQAGWPEVVPHEVARKRSAQ